MTKLKEYKVKVDFDRSKLHAFKFIPTNSIKYLKTNEISSRFTVESRSSYGSFDWENDMVNAMLDNLDGVSHDDEDPYAFWRNVTNIEY